jgi:hypothetical protein
MKLYDSDVSPYNAFHAGIVSLNQAEAKCNINV